jgi:hypothetical protein
MKDQITGLESGSPITGTHGEVSSARVTSKSPLSSPSGKDFSSSGKIQDPKRQGFIKGLSQLFGFRQDKSKGQGVDGITFVKVDANSDLKVAQSKLGKTFHTKMSGKLEELFDSWLQDVTDTYAILEDRNKRISELEFAIANDPFLGMAADMYADEATQIDVQGKLIDIECPNQGMKKYMEELMEQWGVTQNRLRSVAYNMASYGDAFWSNKVTKNGVVRIIPIGIHQVKERLEFNPVQVQTDLSLQKGYITAINRNAKLQALFDTLDDEDNEEFADLFDTRLFGFAIDDDMVVPPWSITHFRLNADQSEYFPMGRSFFLKALAPFRQCNATMVLQSIARVMSFPVTIYSVTTAPGMDEAQQFDKVNEIREEYEAIGDAGAGSEAYSVNTKIWAPKGLMELEMHSPQIDINATGDIEMYQDRVAVASGIPKGYLVQEWGGFGNSAISLVEQYKPFARRVFTVQSGILEGLGNLFRLHFAITGDFDYRTPFVLSMKFPNEETSDLRMAAKEESLNLSKNVLDTVANIVGAINDPLPPDVIRDIMTKFSFLDPDDIKKWVKPNPNQVEHEEGQPEEFEGGAGGGGMGGGGMGGGGGMPPEGLEGGEEGLEGLEGEGEAGAPGGAPGEEGNPPGGEIPGPTGEEAAGMPDDFNQAMNKEKRENYLKMERSILREARETKIRSRYFEKETNALICEAIIKEYSRIDESCRKGRHYKFNRIESCNIPMYELFQKQNSKNKADTVLHESVLEDVQKAAPKLSWEDIKRRLHENAPEVVEPGEQSAEDQEQDEIRARNIKDILS